MISSSKSLLIFVFVYSFWIFLFGKSGSPNSADLDQMSERAEKSERKLGDHSQRLDYLEQEVRQLGKRNVQVRKVSKEWKEPIPVLVFACNRPLAVRDHVQKLLKHRPDDKMFPIFVSQDCDNEDVKSEVMGFGDKVHYIKHISGDKVKMSMPEAYRYGSAYYKIARHYKLALDHIFLERNYTSVIVTEDDLDIASDFFSYFSSTRYLLEVDPKLWCVTAWNDNGKPETIDINSPEQLYRSDFMAGLGWMTTLKIWEELGPMWPSGFWDDWMREPVQRKGRQCIRPEVSRTGMMQYGMNGVSQGLFFTEHLVKVKVNENFTDFEELDLDYLLPENYRQKIKREVMEKAEEIEFDYVTNFVLKPENKGKSVRVMYTGTIDFVEKAEKLGIMNDFKAGVPRTAYDGIVTCFINGIRIYLVPDRSKIQPYA